MSAVPVFSMNRPTLAHALAAVMPVRRYGQTGSSQDYHSSVDSPACRRINNRKSPTPCLRWKEMDRSALSDPIYSVREDPEMQAQTYKAVMEFVRRPIQSPIGRALASPRAEAAGLD
jgi:hypothetical protein